MIASVCGACERGISNGAKCESICEEQGRARGDRGERVLVRARVRVYGEREGKEAWMWRWLSG